MCGRYALYTRQSRIAQRYFDFKGPVSDTAPRYNIAPGTQITMIRADTEAGENGVSFDLSLWGFRPHWADEKAPQPINAKSETVAKSPYFREAFSRRRCLVPANGWFEWRRMQSGKQPYFITLSDPEEDEVLFLAGIWTPAGTNSDTRCAILTQPAAESLSFIHDRQPVVLDPSRRWDWLDTDVTEREAIREVARPLDPKRLRAYPVSTRVNRPVNDDAELVRPVEA